MLLSIILSLTIVTGTAVILVRGVKLVRASKQTTIMVAFALAVILAAAVGVWLGIFHEFKLSDHVRVQGAPIPLVVFVLEDQNWTDFVKPWPIGYVCMVANALFPMGIIGLLCTLIFRIVTPRHR